MPLTQARPCPVCASQNHVLITVPGDQHLARCHNCGMVYTRWEPSIEELGAYYGSYPVVEDLSQVTLKRYDELLERFEAYRKTGKILDVGCGSGAFLQRAKFRGWSAFGTEFGGGPIAACRQRGISVFEGPLEPRDHPAEGYDVICSFEVVEHVAHPREEIGKMLQLLRPGGLLYLTVPNYNCLARRIDRKHWNIINYPEHLNHFTPRTFRRMLREKGLQKSWLTTTGFSLERWMTKKQDGGIGKKEAHRAQDEFRETIESNAFLRFAKASINTVLNLLHLGDSMKAGYIKPAA